MKKKKKKWKQRHRGFERAVSMKVRRIYVEKKPEYAVQAKALLHEAKTSLGLAGLEDVRVFIRYDVENISPAAYQKALRRKKEPVYLTEGNTTYKRSGKKILPNDPCPCGSGKKYKKCHGRK